MNSVGIQLLIVVLLIAGNGILAMAEIALVSARKTRLQQWANEGNERAKAALEFSNSPSRFLSTVQIGITLVGILSGALGGATLAQQLEEQLEKIPHLAQYSEVLSVGTVVLLITYLSLILGELVPKRLALENPERIATFVALPMKMLATIARPIERILTTSTELILRMFGLDSNRKGVSTVTEEEIKTLIEEGTQAGMLNRDEQQMMERVMGLSDRKIVTLMTPRPDVVWLDLEDDVTENLRKISESRHSHFPVANGGLDNILGMVHVKDILTEATATTSIDFSKIAKPAVFVPASTGAMKLLEMFKETRIHCAFVVDEYGVMQGIVTLNNVMEAVVGDIPAANPDAEPQAAQREDGSWLLDGMIAIEEFKRIFTIEVLPNEERGIFQTLAGFIMSELGRVPAAADSFHWGHLRFEVVDMDANRIDKVLVSRVSPTR